MYELSEGKIGCQWSREADVWAVACVVCFESEPTIVPFVEILISVGGSSSSQSRHAVNYSHL